MFNSKSLVDVFYQEPPKKFEKSVDWSKISDKKSELFAVRKKNTQNQYISRYD